jgi:hypothetical protein
MSGAMLGADFYAAVAAVVVAWIVLIYVVTARSGRSGRGLPIRHRELGDRVPAARGSFVEQQFRAVMAGPFEKRRLLNSGEYRVFKTVEDCVTAAGRGYRVFAQTSLGEILASPDEQAYHSINSKRVDILVVDQGGWPVLAVEFQGQAHYQGTAALRDAVKKEALVKAGVGYVEVFARDTVDEIRLLIRERLGWKPRSVSLQPATRA